MGVQETYKALADPTRREILRLLREGELTAGEIAEQFDMTWPSVSRHLSLLAGAGLVRNHREGSYIRYALTTSVLEDILTELADLTKRPANSEERVKRP